MKKFLAFVLAIAAAIGGWSFLQKRKQPETPEKPALCIVLEAGDLFPKVDFSQLKTEIYTVVEQYGYIRLIVADEEPYTAVSVDVQKPDKQYTKAKQKRINDQYTTQIIEMANAAAAKTPENDILAGIKRGKQELARCRDAASRDMIVISSGVSRAGSLRFQDFGYDNGTRMTNALLTAKPEQIVHDLAATYSIPDLSAVDAITWYGIGASAGRQVIPNSVQPKLESLWLALTEEAGCPADFQEFPFESDAPETDLHATVIDFGEDQLSVDMNTVQVSLDEETLSFVPDDAIFIDIEQTKKVLQPYAEQMISSDAELYLIGLTATIFFRTHANEVKDNYVWTENVVLHHRNREEANIRYIPFRFLVFLSTFVY